MVQKKSVSEESNIDYSHHSIVKDFQLVISGVIREDVICNVKNSDCFSLMFDESTDVSVSQNLIICIRYLSVDKVSARVEPTTSFLAILIELNQHILALIWFKHIYSQENHLRYTFQIHNITK